jgi:hypothetical protein
MSRFEYREEDDVAVFEYGDYGSYERSVDVANFVVDLDGNGNFLGLEVIGASERLPLSKQELAEVENVDVDVRDDGESLMVSITLENDSGTASLNLPVTRDVRQPA